MIRFGGTCFVLMATLASAPGARAEEAIDPYALSPEQLFNATVISASRTPESIWEAPTAIYVVSAADIERAGATSIAEALRLVPGVQVARINTSGWAVSVRGFNSALANKLLVLIDGRESYDPLFSGVYWDVQDTAPEDIERIEVIRGPGASLWGANAVNGVINIITRRAADTQGVLVSATTGNTERGGVTARYGGAIGESTHWRIYGRAFDRAGQETLTGDDDNSAWRAWRGGFRVDVDASARDAVTLQGDIYRSDTGQLRTVVSMAAPFAVVEREDITAEGANVLARWTREIDADARLTVQAYVDMTRREQRTLEDRRTTFDLDLQYEFPTFGTHDVIVGARYRHTSDEITATEIIRSDDDTHEAQLFSAFVQDQVTLSPSWRLTLGSKFDDHHYTGIEIQPSARLQWTGERHTLWGAVSRAVRSPSELDREFDILFAAGPPFPGSTLPITVELLPSPQFESEEVVAYELGYRRQLTPNVDLDIALFHNQYDGLATLTPLPLQPALDPPRIILIPIVTTNATEGQTSGAEFVVNWRASDTFDVSLSYSFLDIELSGPPPGLALDAEIAEGQSPRHQGNLRVHWSPVGRLSLDGALYYVDDLPAYQIDAYVRADLRVGYRLADNLQLELIGQNLLDDQHREFGAPSDVNAATIERNIFGRLSWRS